MAEAFADSFTPQLSTYSRVSCDGLSVVWSDESARPVVLSTVDDLILQVFDGVGTVEEIASDVSAVFGVDPATALARVQSALNHFGAFGLISGALGQSTRDDLFPLEASG